MKKPNHLDMKYKERQELLRSVNKERMSEEKLTQEELLEWLKNAFDPQYKIPLKIHLKGGRGQAYTQLKEIVGIYYHPLGHMTRYPNTKEEEEWIRIK